MAERRSVTLSALVRALGLNSHVNSIESMARSVSLTRSRPIRLQAQGLRPLGVSGAWLLMADQDLILFESETSRRHQAQIVAHELGHMLCGHPGAQLPQTNGNVDFLDRAARHMLARHGYEATDERDAEIVADLLLEHVDSTSRVAPTDPVASALFRP
jgi:hypothetical protein